MKTSEITIVPVTQDNKGRFNRRSITFTGERVGYDLDVFVGTTDTGKEVYVAIFALYNASFTDINDLTVGIRYTSDDAKRGYKYDSSLGWKNQYEITAENLYNIKQSIK